MGSFKAELWAAVQRHAPAEAVRAEALEVRDGWLYEKGSQTPAKAVILASSKAPQPERLLSLAARSAYPRLNPPRSGLLSKPEYQSILLDIGVPTPPYNYNVASTGRAVLKPAYGEAGNGVKLTEEAGKAYAQGIITNPLQELAGWDIRIVMFLGEPIGAMLRINTNDWRSNTHQGGHPVTFWAMPEGKRPLMHDEVADAHAEIVKWLGFSQPKPEWFEWGQRIAAFTGLQYFAMDILLDENKKAYVIDINPSAAQDESKRNMVRIKRALRVLKDKGYLTVN
jgi:hypothetical protein